MNYQLRTYQNEAVEAGVEFLTNKKEKRNKIIVQPTAAGKSLVVANIARQLEEPVLCLQPTKELLIQNFNKFISYGEKASIYSASFKKREVGEVTYATIKSIWKKPELFKDFKYIIVDECHLMSPKDGSMHTTLFDKLNLKILGLTATPFRLKSYSEPQPHSQLVMLNRMRPKVFSDLLYVTQIQEMIDNEYWAPLEYYTRNFNRSTLIANNAGADFTQSSMVNALNEQGVVEFTIKWAKKLRDRERKQILIFAPSIEVSETIAKKLGIDSVTTNTKSKDRENYISRFDRQLDWAISNVNVLSVGYDSQRIDAIIDLTPTLSMARYYQKLGRGVRVDLSPNPTKEDCIVIDLVGNYEIFGAIEDLVCERVDGKWSITSNGELLTHVPLVPFEEKTPLKELEDNIIPFGRFVDERFKDVPAWYWKWVLKKLSESPSTIDMFRYARSVI